MSLADGSRLGPYEILGPLGTGGMGEVYRARDTRLEREVAIKVLPASVAGDADRLRRFEQEARATGRLNHPNILVIYDIGTHEGMPYVVEELLDGGTLRQRQDGSPLPPRKAIDYAIQIANGLAAAHEKGIVHRDLKPENLFVTRDGRVKILDFGLAKLTRPEGVATDLSEMPTAAETGPGVVLGTVGYMSPEQVRGRIADHRTDIFSLGSILYEMLTGERAFRGNSSVETMSAILKEEPPDLSETSPRIQPALQRIVQHCLEKNPEERFQSARDLAFDLESLTGSAATAVRPSLDTAGKKGFPVAATLAAVMILAALVAGYLAGRFGHTAPDGLRYKQVTFRRGTVHSARFAPDGRTIVYAAAWDGMPSEIFSARSEGAGSRSLDLSNAEILSISSKGEMALLLDWSYSIGWLRAGRLARVPLAGGAPRDILEEVDSADWDPAGERLAITRSVESRYRLEYPPGRVLYETDGWVSQPRFSPDGTRIAFFDHPLLADNIGRVSVIDLEGTKRELTDIWNSTSGLAWSPDGGEIWFTAGETGTIRSLRAVDLTGRLRLVTNAPADLTLHGVSRDGRILLSREVARRGIIGLRRGETKEGNLSWLDWSFPSALSAGGETLLFTEQGEGGGSTYAAFMRGMDGSPAVRLGEGLALDISSDGKWVLSRPIDRNDRLVLLPVGAGESRTIEVPIEVSLANFLPDGRFLIQGRETKGHGSRLFVVDDDDSAPRPITPEGIGFLTSVTRVGRYAQARGPEGQQMLYPIDAGEPRPLAVLPQDATVVSWADDGRSLLFARPGGISVEMVRLDLETGRTDVARTLMPADPAGILDIGPVLSTADGEAYAYGYRRILSTLFLAEEGN